MTIRQRPRRRVIVAGLAAMAVAVVAVLGINSLFDFTDPAASAQPSVSAGAETRTAGEAAQSSATADLPANPVITRVPKEQWQRIVETGTWRPGCPVKRKDLRRLDISFVDFDGREQRGSIVAHADTIEDIAEIFSWMYVNRFPIQSLLPVEEFGGDVNASLAANNTSAFNCRRPNQINAPVSDSPHANGRSIDINPVQNPWRDLRCDCWKPSREFKSARATGPGVIRKGSPVIQQFRSRGWVWQNIKVPDYMHFDTGYPSRPRSDGPRDAPSRQPANDPQNS